MHPFIAALVGGALIGLSAAFLMLVLGRIAGISGIVGGVLPPSPVPDWAWRVAFVIGLVAAPFLVAPFLGAMPIGTPVVGRPVLVIAGLLVGAGTALGGGCTSGHGICGLARLSARSMAAVAMFMLVAAATVFVARHLV